MPWFLYADSLLRKAYQCLYHLRLLRDFRLPLPLLRDKVHDAATIESIQREHRGQQTAGLQGFAKGCVSARGPSDFHVPTSRKFTLDSAGPGPQRFLMLPLLRPGKRSLLLPEGQHRKAGEELLSPGNSDPK